MRFRYSLHRIPAVAGRYWADRTEAIQVGRATARLLGHTVQLQMEYAYNEAPDEWHLGGLSHIQPQTYVDDGSVIV